MRSYETLHAEYSDWGRVITHELDFCNFKKLSQLFLVSKLEQRPNHSFLPSLLLRGYDFPKMAIREGDTKISFIRGGNPKGEEERGEQSWKGENGEFMKGK